MALYSCFFFYLSIVFGTPNMRCDDSDLFVLLPGEWSDSVAVIARLYIGTLLTLSIK